MLLGQTSMVLILPHAFTACTLVGSSWNCIYAFFHTWRSHNGDLRIIILKWWSDIIVKSCYTYIQLHSENSINHYLHELAILTRSHPITVIPTLKAIHFLLFDNPFGILQYSYDSYSKTQNDCCNLIIEKKWVNNKISDNKITPCGISPQPLGSTVLSKDNLLVLFP